MIFFLILIFVLGFWAWGFVEYLIHGILSHRFKTPVSPMHWQHHKDPRRVFTSPLAVLIIGPLLWWVFSFVLGVQYSAAFVLGVIVGFGHYEFVHWRIHFREPKNEKQQSLKNHHLAHHFSDSLMYHGVTTQFWDKVFSTLPDEVTRNGHFKKVAHKPVIEGVSNFRDIYSLRSIKLILKAYR